MEQAVQTLKNLRKGLIQEPSKDLLLALLIAVIGLTGSYLVLGKSILSPSDTNFQGNSQVDYSKLKAKDLWLENVQKKADELHIENLSIQGNMTVGGIIRINNLAFDAQKNYRIDFGNGIQHQMTSQVMSMRYTSPGIYLVQCYLQQENQWLLISATSINIKEDKNRSY
jgi:hypothetical protein